MEHNGVLHGLTLGVYLELGFLIIINSFIKAGPKITFKILLAMSLPSSLHFQKNRGRRKEGKAVEETTWSKIGSRSRHCK